MSEFVIDKSRGIAYFRSLLEEFETPNLITYDNETWGNMTPYFAKNEEERVEIEEKDREILDMLDIERMVALTTPPENTFLEIDGNVLSTLILKKAEGSIPLRANGVVISENLRESIGVVIAPKDCAVVVMKSKHTDVSVILHIGAPQVMQGFHKQVVRYLKSIVEDLSGYYVYIFPHITVANYKLSEEKVNILDSSLSKYLGDNNQFDFILAFKEDLAEFGISEFVESGIDSYEAAKNGNMYSHTLEKELKKKEIPFTKGAHNVVVKI